MSFKPQFRNLNQRTTKITSAKLVTAIRAEVNNFKPIKLQPTLVDGVIEGGGALGAAYPGALRVLHDNNIWFARVAGTSAGAIMAAMIAVGFTAPEIQWLCSAYEGKSPVPRSLRECGISEPIDFNSFLDLPKLDDIGPTAMRRTILWKALKGTIIDEIGRTRIPIPTQREAVDDVVKKVMAIPGLNLMPNADDLVRKAVNAPLTPLPDQALRVRDFLPDTESLRVQFADTVWKAVAGNIPVELLLTNLLHEGGLFEGTVFLKTIKQLFGRKVHHNPDATVLFKHLEIPLAVIASDTKEGRMRVYSSMTDPNMEVAEAVRRSMSIPFVFQPRNGGQFVDGGLCSNFPLWLFAEGGEEYWPVAARDDTRPKIGFVLEENRAAKSDWNVEPARFATPGNPPRVDDMAVLKPVLAEKIRELGLFAPGEFPLPEVERMIADIELFQELAGVNGLDKENIARTVITKGLMTGRTYYDVVIPLLGYHWLDFGVNEDEDDLLAMWDRAWHATLSILGTARGNQPALVRDAATQASPYKRD